MFLKVWLRDDAAGDPHVITKEDDSPVDYEGDVFSGMKRARLCECKGEGKNSRDPRYARRFLNRPSFEPVAIVEGELGGDCSFCSSSF